VFLFRVESSVLGSTLLPKKSFAAVTAKINQYTAFSLPPVVQQVYQSITGAS